MFTKILVFFAMASSVLSDPSGITRPCDFKDLQCIRDVFAANTACKTNVEGSVPAEYNADYLFYEIQYFNSSAIDTNIVIRNVNLCSVSEFFYNGNTATYVMSLDCPNIEFDADRMHIEHGTKQENLYHKFIKTFSASLIQLTVNIKKEDNFDLCRSNVFIDATNPKLNFVPADSDERSVEFLARQEQSEFLSKLYLIEESKWAASPLFIKYFNSYICDFGCQ